MSELQKSLVFDDPRKPKENACENTVYNMDCFIGLEKIKDKSIKVLIADPPYTRFFGGDYITSGGDFKFLELYFSKLIEVIMPKMRLDGCLFFFCDFRTFPAIFNGFIKFIIPANLIVWQKNFIGPGVNFRSMHELIAYFPLPDAKSPKDRTLSDIWRADRVTEKIHTYQKPEKLYSLAIANCSEAGDLVVDPFLGSGTAAVVSRQLNRRFIGFEMNPTHFKAAVERIKRVSFYSWEK